MSNSIETYTQKYCDALEIAYERGFMSEGGSKVLDLIFAGQDLKEKSILDFGSGFGGAALHLAEKYGARVCGLEVNQYLVDEAMARIPANLREHLSFINSCGEKNLPLADNHFDIIFSKGVIVHLTNQEHKDTFKEFYRILKPNGHLIIHDWLSEKDGQWSPNIEKMAAAENLYLNPIALETYKKMLLEQGFTDIFCNDESKPYSKYNQDIVTRLQQSAIKQKFVKNFGLHSYQEYVHGHQIISDEFANGKLICAEFKAIKPNNAK